MPYQYDVFFSYKRHPESDDWHEKVKDKIVFWVEHKLARRVNVFFDKEDIRTGMRWRIKLANALKTSRCMVCVWSPLYFQSQWCLSEWQTFNARNGELVVAASYFDGKTFPQEAQDVQYRDFSRFASTIPSFWLTESADLFERTCLRPFAEDLARAIDSAPSFNDAFPLVEAPSEDVQPEGTIHRIGNG